jgi:hypothetical protein
MRYLSFININLTNVFWLFLTSCFIIIGAGHGVMPLFFLEFLYFPFFTHKEFKFPNSYDSISLALIGLFFFIGHAMIIISFFVKSAIRKSLFLLVSIIMIGLSVLLVVLSRGEDAAFILATGSILPFLLVTLITLFIRPIDMMIHRNHVK